MKNILLIIAVLLVSLSINAQEIKWMTFNDALKAQQKTPKKIIVDAYTNWCGWCKKLDKETFSNPDVANFINKNYYAVKFNAEGNETITYKGKTYSNPNYSVERANGRNSAHDLANNLGVRSFPNLLFFDENGTYLGPIPGYKTPKQLEVMLKLFSTNAYKNINSQEDFQKYVADFKYTFKE